ncbi:MAG: Hsp20/alpha crystallin family protein [Nocardiopsaceae bacterium]|nr:Hsp20/alpha crystallin family protein [Nocardiopsaceae bacterium]
MYLTTLDREFDHMVRRAFGPWLDSNNSGNTAGGGRDTTFAMDAVRRDGEVVLRFDVPGVNPEQIDVTVNHGYLTVSATREDTTTEGDQYVVRERSLGTVTRSIRLADNLDTEKIQASNVNGVLEIRIPVSEEAKPRKITVSDKKELTS